VLSLPLISQKLGVHLFGGSVAMPLGLLDAIFVGFLGLVMSRVWFLDFAISKRKFLHWFY